MTSTEVREIMDPSSSYSSEKSFEFGAFVLDAGLVVDSIKVQKNRTHLSTNIPSEAFAEGLSHDIAMISPAHELGMPLKITVPQDGPCEETISVMREYSSASNHDGILVISGINRMIGRNDQLDECMHKVLDSKFGPRIVGITIGESATTDHKAQVIYEKFDATRPFEARIPYSKAVDILLSEEFDYALAHRIVQSLANDKRLTWHSIHAQISKTEDESEASPAAVAA